MPFNPCENAEPIPGYLLKERIGIGGYGEVWKVSAPGGLTKAIKFVYGRMDDERGARELKALGRIKEVRHPFLLSLERFDVVEGQLVVVTELADMSLMDRYRQCRDEGLPGVPRDELLVHLRDAADALDYMSEKYGLQHLDIKPENLLVVGGRIKVADFGLVKDLQDAHATAIGGVTPLYATPEAFDGKASRQSDQYSLAIVYQEMLTGVLPFPGFTTAQLAVQHMHSPPLLGSLPEADRPIIGRALSKQPAERFASCREMVDNLLGAAPRVAPCGQSVAAKQEAESDGPRATVDLRSTPCGSSLDETSNHPDSAGETAAEDRELAASPLPALEPIAQQGELRPTVFVGIGGEAARVLRRLRRRLHERFGDRLAAPGFQLLLLDTDPHSLRAAERGDPEDALSPDETLYLPLRKPAEYRAASDKILGWLSRRWLYNIPRSLRTEGLRPLGRLAYVDHAENVKERIRQAVAEASTPAAVDQTLQTAGTSARSRTPRVFLVSSISGGAGGGMVLDVAYAARGLMSEQGFDPNDVCGVLLHSTLNKSAANDLRKANAYATLTELNYFNHCRGGFKNGAASILPDGELAEPPFGETYLINLGNNLSEADLDAACGAVARYLYLDAATACGAALDHCRRATRAQVAAEDGVPRLRSFALHAIGCDKYSIAASQADLLCHRVINSWHADEQGYRRPEKPELGADELIQRLYAAVDKALGGSAETQFQALIDQAGLASLAELSEPNAGGPYSVQLERIHALLGTPPVQGQGAPATPTRVEAVLQEAGKKLAAALSNSISKNVTALVEDPRGRLPVGFLAVNMFQEQLRELRQEADETSRRLSAEAALVRAKFQRGEIGGQGPGWLSFLTGKRRKSAEECLMDYCRGRLRSLVFQQLSSLLQSVSSQVSALNERLLQLRPRLEQLGRSFASTLPSGEPQTDELAASSPRYRGVTSAPAAVPALLDPELLRSFESQVQQEVLAPLGGLLGLSAATNDQWKQVRAQLQLRAREAALFSMKEMNAARLLLERYPKPEQLARNLTAAAEKTSPALPIKNAANRLIAVVPRDKGGAEVAEAARQCLPDLALTVPDSDSDIVFCREAELISLTKAAAALIESRPDFAAAARRVLTRLDIPWSPLPLGTEHLHALEAPAQPLLQEALAHG